MDLRVLTWNVCHGRAAPPALEGHDRSTRRLWQTGHDRYLEFATALDRWAWDVALLQEVPPWWPAQLTQTLHCEAHRVLTAHNTLLPLRRAVAVRAPELMRSSGGGANAILARSDRIVQARSALLCRRPEHRWVHGVALACGVWVSNLQASPRPAPAERDLRAAIRMSAEWAAAHRLPLILGGDLNLAAAGQGVDAERLRTAASSELDHVLCGEGIEIRTATVERLERGGLSDHVPLAVTPVI